MNLSKTKIGAFFLVLLIMGWLLYPRELFLGYIYEGTAYLKKSEQNYKNYLEKNPWSKFATLRLVSVYERMGKPQEALDLLVKLYEHRKKDWELANIYLDHIENKNDEELLYKTRIMIAHNFRAVPHFPKEKIEQLLYEAYEYAQWQQKTEEELSLLMELTKISRKPKQYYEALESLDLGFKNTDKILASLEAKIKLKPKSIEARRELSDMKAATGNFDEAFQLINDGLKLEPHQIDLLKEKAYFEEKTKQFNRAQQDLETVLQLPSLKEEDRPDLLQEMADILAKEGEGDKAIKIDRDLLSQNQNDPDVWLNLMQTLTDFKKYDEAIALLNDYLKKFPDDLDQQKNLAEIYLYEKKNISQIPFYMKYVQQSHSIEFAVDVGELLLLQQKNNEALSWSRKVFALFPSNFKGGTLLMDVLIQNKEYVEALNTGLKLLEKDPQNFKMNLRIAEIYSLLFNNKMAIHYYQKLEKLKPNDRDTLVLLGKELFFLGDPRQSLLYLNRALSQKQDDPEAWFWSSEDHWALGLKAKALADAKQVRHFIGLHKNPSMELARMDLKSSGRIDFTSSIIEKYQQAEKKYPHNLALQSDFLELLLANKIFSKAIPLLEKNLEKNPSDRGTRHLLAELHDQYDSRATTSFKFLDLGADEATEAGIAYHSYLTQSLELNAEFWAGTYDSPEHAFSGEAQHGQVTTLYHFQNWQLGGGIGFGQSFKRTTFSPLAQIMFQPEDGKLVSLQYQYRSLRVDLPQAVSAGALEDKTELNWNYRFAKKLNFSGKYEFDRNYLPDGAFSYENIVEPSLTYTLFKKPEILMGYQYTFSHTFDHGGFSTQVPLLPKVSAHYLTGQIGGHLTNHFYTEGGFFIGEDTIRHLHLINGDLWGLRGQIQWNVLSWLDFEGSYAYGRESLTGVAGQSHNVSVGLSGHW